MNDDEDTPAQVPDAKKRKSSGQIPALERCPACKGDARKDCTYCVNETVGASTRYVSKARAEEIRMILSLSESSDEVPDTEPGR
jgi:hypothetical protein